MAKNIWILNHYIAPPSTEEGHRHNRFAKILQDKGYKVTLFYSSYLHRQQKQLFDKEQKYSIEENSQGKYIGIKTRSYKGNGRKRIYNMFDYFRGVLKMGNKIKRDEGKPDIIIASSPHPLTMIAGIRMANKMGIPCICEVRDFWPEVFFLADKIRPNGIIGRILLLGEYWIYKKSDALIFLKEGDVTYLTERKWDISQGGKIDLKKCHYINNGINLYDFNKSKEENKDRSTDLDGNNFNVVYIGAIRPINNVGMIVDAARILKDRRDIQFIIYGDGTEKIILENKAKEEGLKNIKFKGYINRNFVPSILMKSSVNILSYSQDQYDWSRGNSSNKLFEYMASGKPIISTVKMGYSIIDKYKLGIELEKNEPEELARAILKIKNMPNKEYDNMAENAQKGAEDFDFNVLTSKLIDVINSLI